MNKRTFLRRLKNCKLRFQIENDRYIRTVKRFEVKHRSSGTLCPIEALSLDSNEETVYWEQAANKLKISQELKGMILGAADKFRMDEPEIKRLRKSILHALNLKENE